MLMVAYSEPWVRRFSRPLTRTVDGTFGRMYRWLRFPVKAQVRVLRIIEDVLARNIRPQCQTEQPFVNSS